MLDSSLVESYESREWEKDKAINFYNRFVLKVEGVQVNSNNYLECLVDSAGLGCRSGGPKRILIFLVRNKSISETRKALSIKTYIGLSPWGLRALFPVRLLMDV